MSKSDHSKSRMDRYNDGDRVTRRHQLVNEREQIAEQIMELGEFAARQVTVNEAVQDSNPVFEARVYTTETVQHVSTDRERVNTRQRELARERELAKLARQRDARERQTSSVVMDLWREQTSRSQTSMCY